jgi:NTE family protein
MEKVENIQIINGEEIINKIFDESIKEIQNNDLKENIFLEEPLIVDEIKEKNTIDFDTLTLAGGSTKGIMILGALQYAQDNYLLNNVVNYIGTSVGAIIGYLLAIGYTPIEIMVYICCNQLLEKMLHFNIVAMINGHGASSFNNIQETLEKMTIQKIGFFPTLKDLKNKFGKTFICTTYNITEDKTEYLSHENYPELPCLTAIRMSSNLPLIFENYKYGNSLFTDGGISDNFPIDIGDKIGKKVLGISLVSEQTNFSKEPNINVLEFIYKLICIPISKIEEYKLKNISEKCKIVRLKDNKLKFFDFDINSKDKLELFSNGYQQMKEQME